MIAAPAAKVPSPSPTVATIQDAAIQYAAGQCSLGMILVAATPRGVCAIFIGDTVEPLIADLRRRFPATTLVTGDRQFDTVAAAVVQWIEDPTAEFPHPLDLHGTPFQRQVWAALRRIPVGETVSYTQIANEIGRPTAMRAVASACGANPVAVVIPCHRVVRRGGQLSGYRWGVARKFELLQREQAMDSRSLNR